MRVGDFRELEGEQLPFIFIWNWGPDAPRQAAMSSPWREDGRLQLPRAAAAEVRDTWCKRCTKGKSCIAASKCKQPRIVPARVPATVGTRTSPKSNSFRTAPFRAAQYAVPDAGSERERAAALVMASTVSTVQVQVIQRLDVPPGGMSCLHKFQVRSFGAAAF